MKYWSKTILLKIIIGTFPQNVFHLVYLVLMILWF